MYVYTCVYVCWGGGGVVSCSVSVPVLLFIQYNIELRVSLCRRRYACVFFVKHIRLVTSEPAHPGLCLSVSSLSCYICLSVMLCVLYTFTPGMS